MHGSIEGRFAFGCRLIKDDNFSWFVCFLSIRGDSQMVLCFRLFLAESSVMFRRLAILEGAGMIKLTSPPLWILALLTH